MSKKSIKNFFISLLLILSIFLSSISLFATTSPSIDADLLSFYTSIKNIQNQLSSISSSVYTSKRENKLLDDISGTLKVFESQVKELNSSLSAYSKSTTLSTIYTLRLETLSVAARLLEDLIRSIQEQLITTNVAEEYQLFKAYIVADSLLNQTLSYFPLNK